MQKSDVNHINIFLTQMFWVLKQWLYSGKRPNWIARTLNRGIAKSASKNISPDGVVALEVIGRKSGRIVTFPLVMTVVDGQRYLASMLGESQWVRNVRTADGRAVLRSGGYEEVQLTEIPATERALILKAYLQAAPGARPHVAVDMDAPIEEFEKVAADYPVFRVTSRSIEE